MMYVRAGFLVLGYLLSAPLYAETTCECPKLACDPCSVQRSVKFFSEKCGPNDSKVKSCSRPLCVPVEQATHACPVPPSAAGPRAPVVVSGVGSEPAVGANEKSVAGKVKVLQGSVSIVHADGQRIVVTKEEALGQGDTIEAGKESGAVVHFAGGNKLHVHPDTTVELKEFKDQQSAESRRSMLNLIRGKIRNQVGQKYDGKTSYYRVMTKGAIAGVRGTDFVVEHHEGVKMETRVEILEGRVIFQNLDETETRYVAKGEGAVYVAPMPTASDFIVVGKLSDVYKMTPAHFAKLDADSRMDVLRAVTRSTASVANDPAICEKPAAKLNQCSWKCEGNPAGAKTCRTDLEHVRCVRQRCNANGQWADETRLPAATSQTTCPATGQTVNPCDY